MSVAEIDNSDIRRIESVQNHRLFDELVSLGSELLLNGKFEKKPYIPPTSPEAELIRQLGTRGLSTALDIAGNNHVFYTSRELRGGDNIPERTEDLVWHDSPFRTRPGDFSTGVDFETIDTVRQFGQALMDDAYKTLGPDVDEHIQLLKDAETQEDYARVFQWLNTRFFNITEDLREPGREDRDYIYNPVRLSRHFTGTYPDIIVPPTCLGISIITASFLEQAGLQHLHAGVMESVQEDADKSLAMTFAASYKLLRTHMPEIDHVTSLALERAIQELEKIERDRGYHVANYVRTKQGKWWQIDTNYDSIVPIYWKSSLERLNGAYEDISTFKDIAPGIERMVDMRINTPANQFGDWLLSVEWEALPSERIAAALQEDESMPQKVCDIMMERFTGRYKEYFPKDVIDNFELIVNNDLLVHAFYALFNKYVLWDNDSTTVTEMCINDPNYLARCVEDVQAMQFLMIPATMIEIAHRYSQSEQGIGHASVELGDPATRIGFAALNDVAVYFDNRLSPSFWMSHWPSKVAVTEALLFEKADREEQRSIIRNNLAHIDVLPEPLKYRKSYGIVDMFLSIPISLEGGDENGEV